MATFPALFDTNALFGFHLNDVILGLAERGLFRPLWSEQILEELSRNLALHGVPESKVERRVEAMRRAFPDATVSGFEDLIDTMTNDPKDRHVLAAGIRANCEVLVTFNLKDFPAESVDDYDIEIVHPDTFLLDQLDLYPGPTVRCPTSTHRRLLESDPGDGRPARSPGRCRVPDFASAVRRYL